jgi:ATP-binding cassette subfamily B protein
MDASAAGIVTWARVQLSRGRHRRRGWLAPEVIQTSAMDCAPAALKCLLDGFGVPASYGRLREACHTSVDGTSIDTLENLAQAVGLEAEQVMMPVDHLLLAESEALPAIVVVVLPDGLMHFVVAWRVHGPLVQLMDPARGRRWVRRAAFLRDVYTHTLPLPAEEFRAWAASDEFLDPLGRRLAALGARGGDARRLIERAAADPGWRALAALDAAARMTAALVGARAVARGTEAARLVDALAADPDLASGALAAEYATATALADASDQVSVRGAVLLKVEGARQLEREERASLPRELAAALEERPARPAAELGRLLARDGRRRWALLACALAIAAGGGVLEAWLFRGLFDRAAGGGGGGGASSAAPVVVIAVLIALALIELPVALATRGAGGRLETRLRRAFLRKIPRLGDSYFQSRPVSDMAERAHLVHRLRGLPALAAELARVALEIAVVTGALAWLAPSVAPLALALGAAMLLCPLAAQPALGERDLRMRTHAGALARFYLDALLGVVPIRTHRAEATLARRHQERLREWVAAARAALRAALAAEALQSLFGFGLAAWLLVAFARSNAGAGAAGPGTILLIVYLALTLPALGQQAALLVQQLPGQRNVTLRLVEPLGAVEENEGKENGGGEGALPARAGGGSGGVTIEVRDLVVQAGGHVILNVGALDVAAGEHVAVVGASGAGKSSLVGLLLGWHRPAQGAVRVDGGALEGAALEELRRHTAWVDPGVYLWNRPLADNLTYGLRAPLPSLEAALDEAELAEVASRLPEGAATPLGEAGGLLSGGEGQRVRYGRGVLRPAPRLVVLDEPFRGLARDQRRELLARARRRWADATLFCVTHDIAETRAFGRVLVLDGGRVVEDGAPAALLAREGSRYRALADAEERVRRTAWATVSWRRLRLEGGRLRVEESE